MIFGLSKLFSLTITQMRFVVAKGTSSFPPLLFIFYLEKSLEILEKIGKRKDRPLTVLVEVAGKRGDKQLITVFGDAPDENKEL